MNEKYYWMFGMFLAFIIVPYLIAFVIHEENLEFGYDEA